MDLINIQEDYKDLEKAKRNIDIICSLCNLNVIINKNKVMVDLFPMEVVDKYIDFDCSAKIKNHIMVCTNWLLKECGADIVFNRYRFDFAADTNAMKLISDINVRLKKWEYENHMAIKDLFISILLGAYFMVPSNLFECIKSYEIER